MSGLFVAVQFCVSAGNGGGAGSGGGVQLVTATIAVLTAAVVKIRLWFLVTPELRTLDEM
ncbi:MAG: hypothetical protein JO008_05100 [Alphaproteobacteria bacterium]|nr:hypothetical protein [Alphaproteobacteria bacterium]